MQLASVGQLTSEKQVPGVAEMHKKQWVNKLFNDAGRLSLDIGPVNPISNLMISCCDHLTCPPIKFPTKTNFGVYILSEMHGFVITNTEL